MEVKHNEYEKLRALAFAILSRTHPVRVLAFSLFNSWKLYIVGKVLKY